MSDRTEQNVVGLAKSEFVIPLFFFGPLVTSAVPLFTWLFIAITVVALIVPYLRRGCDWRQLIRPTADVVALYLVAVYVFLGTIWAADPSAALGKSALLLTTALITFAASKAMTFLDKPQLGRATLAFAAGAFIGALFVLFELLTDGAITRFVVNAFVWLKPASEKHAKISHGIVMEFKAREFSRNVAMLVFYLWPGLLALTAIEGRARRAAYIGLFVVAVAAPVLLSDRLSSQIALVGSLLVFPLAQAWRRGVVRALVIFWCLAFALVLPLSFFAYENQLQVAPWLSKSARHRVIIWEYTAERVFDRPWFGIGAASTPVLRKQHTAPEQPEGFVVPRSTGSHAHNLFLQAWYELGVVGVMMIAFAGVILVLGTTRLPTRTQPFAIAMIAALFFTMTFAWSMWQAWLLCAVGLMLIYFLSAAIAGVTNGAADLIGCGSESAKEVGRKRTELRR